MSQLIYFAIHSILFLHYYIIPLYKTIFVAHSFVGKIVIYVFTIFIVIYFHSFILNLFCDHSSYEFYYNYMELYF